MLQIYRKYPGLQSLVQKKCIARLFCERLTRQVQEYMQYSLVCSQYLQKIFVRSPFCERLTCQIQEYMLYCLIRSQYLQKNIRRRSSYTRKPAEGISMQAAEHIVSVRRQQRSAAGVLTDPGRYKLPFQQPGQYVSNGVCRHIAPEIIVQCLYHTASLIV